MAQKGSVSPTIIFLIYLCSATWGREWSQGTQPKHKKIAIVNKPSANLFYTFINIFEVSDYWGFELLCQREENFAKLCKPRDHITDFSFFYTYSQTDLVQNQALNPNSWRPRLSFQIQTHVLKGLHGILHLLISSANIYRHWLFASHYFRTPRKRLIVL